MFWLIYMSIIIGMIWQLLSPFSPQGVPVEITLNLPRRSGGGGRRNRVVTDYFDGD